jgi:predicted transcriptional regulator
MSTYPDYPGFKTFDDTTMAAAAAMAERAIDLRTKVFVILRMGSFTADECAAILRESPLAIRPRLSELRTKHLIVDTGHRRLNVSGKQAIVWIAVKS